MSWIKHPSASFFCLGEVSRTKAVNGLVVGQFMGEVYKGLPGHDHRLPRVILNKGEDNGRNIECVG